LYFSCTSISLSSYQLVGLLPRPEGKWEDIPLPMPNWSYAKKDGWVAKKALFGQNDYIGVYKLLPARTAVT